jgi:hypothetical protein
MSLSKILTHRLPQIDLSAVTASSYASKWTAEMVKEYDALMPEKVWKEVNLPASSKGKSNPHIISCKWVFAYKVN